MLPEDSPLTSEAPEPTAPQTSQLAEDYAVLCDILERLKLANAEGKYQAPIGRTIPALRNAVRYLKQAL